MEHTGCPQLNVCVDCINNVVKCATNPDGGPCGLDERTVLFVAGVGEVEVLRWLLERVTKCQWYETITAAAARRGNLAVLSWAMNTMEMESMQSMQSMCTTSEEEQNHGGAEVQLESKLTH
jgi:hypothetical protein